MFNSIRNFSYQRSIDELVFLFLKILPAILIFFFGYLLAKSLKKILLKLMQNFKPHKFLKKTPLSYFLGEKEVLDKIELAISNVFFYLLMLIVVTTSVSVLELHFLTNVLNQILNYIPNIFSAVLIIFIGLIISGVAENLIKKPIKVLSAKAAIMVGKFTSYLIMTVSSLIAFGELGIASRYIEIILIGFTFLFTLSLSLAIGLGSKDLVSRFLLDLYEKNKKPETKQSKKTTKKK